MYNVKVNFKVSTVDFQMLHHALQVCTGGYIREASKWDFYKGGEFYFRNFTDVPKRFRKYVDMNHDAPPIHPENSAGKVMDVIMDGIDMLPENRG